MITNLNFIREQLDIVEVIGRQVALQKKGVNYICLCPFHAEKTPSFTVSPKGQFFKCFGCGKSGDVFRFQQELSGQTFPEAVTTLAQAQNLPVERAEKDSVNEE